MVELNENIEINQETQKKSIELASLVWLYFSKSNYKELLEDDFKSLKKLKKWLKWLIAWTKEEVTIVLEWKERTFNIQEKSELEKIIEEKERKYSETRKRIEIWANKFSVEYIPSILWNDNDDVSELDFDVLLSWDFDINDTLTRIRELYSEPWVKELYNEELNRRKTGFELLEDWEKELIEVFLVEAKIKKAKKIILDLRIKSFLDRKTLKPNEVSYIKRIQAWIEKLNLDLYKLLQKRELATAHRLHTLKKYKTELDNTWFVKVPSRQVIIDEILEKLILWENVLLTWPTWTGKTVLAIEAVKTLAIQKGSWYEEIDWKKLWEEITEEVKKAVKDKVSDDDFVSVLSWHSGITTAEFIAKPSLKSDWKGWMYTDTQLWKLLKAFVEWKIPIIDEIDLIPNDVLMRVKHLFTLRPGQKYSPQEGHDKKYVMQNTSIVATANIKSEKHPDREELDPAIVRLFKWVQVPYFTEDESYDISLAYLMESQGYIYDIDVTTLEKDGILYNLIKSLKEIEDSYLWKWSGLSVNIWWSDKSWLYLQKAVLEIWNFVSMFNWFKESGKSFKQFIKWKIIEFVSNWAYSKNDKLLLIKIFSSNWLIIRSDLDKLETKIVDIAKEELEKNILSNNDIFSEEWTKFIDPYELANLDPYNIRNLDELELWDEQKRLKPFMEKMSEKAIENIGDENWDELWSMVDNVLSEIEKDPEFEIEEKKIDEICKALWKTKDIKMIHKLPILWDKWKKSYEQLLEDDTEGELKNIPATTVDVVSENMYLTKYIISRRQNLLDEYKKYWTINVNWFDFPVKLSYSDKRKVEQLNSNDIKIVSEKTVTINSEGITVTEVIINWTEFIAIQVPNFLKWKRLKETYIWKQLANNSNLPSDFLDQTLDMPYIIYGKTNAKDSSWNNKVNIPSYNPSSDTDAVRESLKKWFNTTNIVYEAILWELIKEHDDLWEDYLNYESHKANKDQDWHEEKIRHLEEIEEVFGIVFNNHADNWKIMWDYWVYTDKDWYIQGFFRGDYSYSGAMGGAVSLELDLGTNFLWDQISFRPSV